MDPIKPGDYTIRTGTRKAPIHPNAVNSASAIYELDIIKKVGEMEREALFILHMNIKNQIIQVELHSIGSVNCAVAYTKEIAKSAIISGASGVVLVHNHPCGDPEPSPQDNDITKDVVLVLNLIKIPLLDHIILGSKAFYSYMNMGKVNEYETIADRKLSQVNF